MFGCRHLNPDLRLKPVLVIVICDHQISAYTFFSIKICILRLKLYNKDKSQQSLFFTAPVDFLRKFIRKECMSCTGDMK